MTRDWHCCIALLQGGALGYPLPKPDQIPSHPYIPMRTIAHWEMMQDGAATLHTLCTGRQQDGQAGSEVKGLAASPPEVRHGTTRPREHCKCAAG